MNKLFLSLMTIIAVSVVSTIVFANENINAAAQMAHRHFKVNGYTANQSVKLIQETDSSYVFLKEEVEQLINERLQCDGIVAIDKKSFQVVMRNQDSTIQFSEKFDVIYPLVSRMMYLACKY